MVVFFMKSRICAGAANDMRHGSVCVEPRYGERPYLKLVDRALINSTHFLDLPGEVLKQANDGVERKLRFHLSKPLF